MYKKLLSVVTICLILASSESCNNHGQKDGRQAKGGVYYGGVFHFNWVINFRSLFPLNVTDVPGYSITSQVYQGLVKLSPKDLSIQPCLATRWEVSDSNKVWTFHLRKGVKYHDDPCFPDSKGREVTAKDFKWCFDQLCTATAQNAQFEVTFRDRVVGADEYYQASLDKKPLPQGGVPGVKVIDDSTLQIRLTIPFGGFLNLLTEPGCYAFPKEALDKYGLDMRVHMVGTGPFMLKDASDEQNILLARNPNYWEYDSHGNQLPYMDGVNFSFVHEKKSELLQFQQDKLEMMYQIPLEIIPQILGQMGENGPNSTNSKVDYSLDVKPSMSCYFYAFQTQDKLFSNKYLRQAFNYAIDRTKIVRYTLQGEGIPGTYGIVPFGAFPGYDDNNVKGYDFNPDKAKELLAKAGYPNGQNFPEITLQTSSDGGERNRQIAEVLQQMLKENLNIKVKINEIPFPQHQDSYMRGKAQVFRNNWSADYPDPQTFLSLLYGGNVPKDTSALAYTNSMRWVNPQFDSLYTHALMAPTDSARYRLYEQAEQVALDDAPYMCIYYEENYYLSHNYVKNFYGNSMAYFDFCKVYLIPPSKRVANPNAN